MKILSTSEAAKRLQVSPDTVLILIRNKALPASRLHETANWRIRLDDLEQYAKQRGIDLVELEPEK